MPSSWLFPLVVLLACANAFSLGAASHGVAATRRSAKICAVGPLPPAGFVWADDALDDAPSSVSVKSTTAAVATPATAIADAPVATPATSIADAPVAAPATAVADAPVAAPATAVADAPTPKPAQKKPAPTPVPKSNVVSNQGLFAPLVLGAKRVMGEQELKQLRADIIGKHSKVIANFVETSESPFGQMVLKRMFEYADKDGNGTLDKDEVRAALRDLGFDFLDEKQINTILNKADGDKNEVIDFEEFVKETPKTLRVNLVKLAKRNGHDLGFLV